MTLLGLLPIFFALTPEPTSVTQSNPQPFLVAIALPGFSLGLALGFIWGAHTRPAIRRGYRANFSGLRAGMIGGLGFSIPVMVLGIVFLYQALHPVDQCVDLACGSLTALALFICAILLLSPLFIGFIAFIGCLVGAFLNGG